MDLSYWDRVLARRLDRRRALASTGAAALGTALLAACGGGDGGGGEDASGLLSKPEDTSSKAVPGGIWQKREPADIPTMDAHFAPGSTNSSFLEPIYQHFLTYGPAIGKRGPIAADAAQSWEIAPDGLTLTFKLGENKWDPRPPTSGRVMDAADVAFSWERTVAISPFGGDLFNSVTPSAPILNLTTPDKKTAVLKLAFPYLSILDIFVKNVYFSIMPVEATDKFDSRSVARGSGPFFLDKYEQSLGWTLSKNPNWHEKGRPFLDGIVKTIIPEYNAGMVQFETGRLWDYPVRQDDILRLKRDHPEMVMLQNQPTGDGAGVSYWMLSQQPDSYMKDVRIRRAASMLMDRQLFIDALYNTDNFRDAGLNVETRWHTHINADAPEWLDPQGKELGEGGQYFQYNPTEAKKLIAAAGYDGRPLSWYYTVQQADNEPHNVIGSGMLREGFNLDFRVLDYQTAWRQVCQRSAGTEFNGFCHNNTTAFNTENYVSSAFTPEGKYRYSAEAVYPGLTDLARKIKVELDRDKQVEMIKQLQREAAALVPYLSRPPGIAFGFTLHQPWLKNFGVFNASRQYVYYWYDKSKQT